MRPSFVAFTSNPCFAAKPRTHFSTTLGFPGVVLTTSCSQPDDFVNSRTDFLLAADRRLDNARPALPIATVRRNSLRLAASVVILFFSSALVPEVLMLLIPMLAPRKPLKCIVTIPSQFAHALFGRIVRPNDPFFQILELLAASFLCREVTERCFLFFSRQRGESTPKLFLRFMIDSLKRSNKFPLMFSGVNAQQQVNESIYLRRRRSRYHGFRKDGERSVLPGVQKQRLPVRCSPHSFGAIESPIRQMAPD